MRPLCGRQRRTGPARLRPGRGRKRRLLYQLDDLGLPVAPCGSDPEHGLAFDLLSSAGEQVTTGHANGVITIDLAEGDDGYREALRVRLDEPYRTLLGHFRHEVAHWYWDALVARAGRSRRQIHSLALWASCPPPARAGRRARSGTHSASATMPVAQRRPRRSADRTGCIRSHTPSGLGGTAEIDHKCGDDMLAPGRTATTRSRARRPAWEGGVFRQVGVPCP